jgi:hypothetical protein
MSALEDTTDRLGKAEAMNLPEALAVISETVWWVTLVDGTLMRYHHDIYDHAMDELGPAERKLIEGTLTGLRFVRNCMGYYVDPPISSSRNRPVPALPRLPRRPARRRHHQPGHRIPHPARQPLRSLLNAATPRLTGPLPPAGPQASYVG